jgi:hypothetical protein
MNEAHMSAEQIMNSKGYARKFWPKNNNKNHSILVVTDLDVYAHILWPAKLRRLVEPDKILVEVDYIE